MNHDSRSSHRRFRCTALFLFLSLGFLSCLSSRAQILGFSSPTSTSSFSVGGNSQREGVSGTVFTDGWLYVAYTGRNTDGYGNAPVYVSLTNGGDASYIYSGWQATLSGPQTIAAADNPAIVNYGGRLVMAYTDSFGSVNLVASTSVDHSAAPPVNWGSTIASIPLSGADGSPSLAVHSINGTPYLFLAARNAADHSLSLVQFDLNLNIVHSMNCPTCTLGFSPALGEFQGKLYIAIQANDNSHNIYYWTTTDGQNLTFLVSTKSDQTSTTPSLAVHNGILYLGFRTNDGNHKFLYKYSYDGQNWSGGIYGGVTMGGSPALIDATGLQADNGDLLNLFVANDSSYWLWGQKAP